MSIPGETMGGIRPDSDPRRPVVAPVVATSDVVDDSAVSWAAIIAGAAAAAALSLALVLLGTGLGLSSVSPWAFEGVSAETFGWATIAWISFTAIAASGLGGYLTGRLRRRWTGVASDETYFRDTAHGFLSWAIATLLTAALLTGSIAAMLGTGARAGASLAGAAAGTVGMTTGGATAALAGDEGEAHDGVVEYYIDQLFRRDADASPGFDRRMPATQAADESADMADPSATMSPRREARPQFPMHMGSRPEAARIIANSLRTRTLDDADTRYLGQLVAERTGLGQTEAEARVTQMHAALTTRLEALESEAREAADAARKASAYAALWLFITLLLGAFTASLLATVGGRHRDL